MPRPLLPVRSCNLVALNQHKKRIVNGDVPQQLQALKVACGFVKAANKLHRKDQAITSSPSGSQTSSASSASSAITDLSRSSTQDSTVAALEVSYPPVAPVASSIVTQETSKCLCGVCGKYGICGCARRANSSSSNRTKDFGFCTDTDFDLAIKDPSTKNTSTQHGGTTWQGHQSTPINETQSQSTSSDNLVAGEGQSSAVLKTEKHPVNGSEMIGSGRYRCSKEASEEFVINNTIEKLGDVADLVVKLGGENLKVHGHETLTYADVLRIKNERAGQQKPNAYKQEVSSDGIQMQLGFPTQPVPLDRSQSTVSKHLRSGSWTANDQTARDFNMVHNYGRFGHLGCRSRFSYPIPQRELETVQKPRVRSRKAPVPATRRLHGMEVAPDACIDTFPLGITAQAAKAADAVQLGAAPPISFLLPSLDKDAHAMPKRKPNAH